MVNLLNLVLSHLAQRSEEDKIHITQKSSQSQIVTRRGEYDNLLNGQLRGIEEKNFYITPKKLVFTDRDDSLAMRDEIFLSHSVHFWCVELVKVCPLFFVFVFVFSRHL